MIEDRYRPAPGRSTLYLIAPTLAGATTFAALLALDAPGHSYIWGPALAILVFLGILMWLARRRLRDCQLITKLLFVEGELDVAIELLEPRCRRRHWLTHGHFLFNRGIAFIFEGEHHKAIEIFERMRAEGAFEQALTRTLEPAEPAYRAFASALGGDLEKAEQALDEVQLEGIEPLTILPRAIIAVRRGQSEEALSLLSERWNEAIEYAGVHTLAALYLVRAMATSIVEPARTNEVERLLSNLYPWSDQWVAWVWVNWPEMQVFCEKNLDPAQKEGDSVSD